MTILLRFIFSALMYSANGSYKLSKYSDTYIAHYNGKKNELVELVSNYGYTVEQEIIPSYFQVRRRKTTRMSFTREINLEIAQQKDKKIVSFIQEEYLSREKRYQKQKRNKRDINVTDTFWSSQWYIDPQHNPTLGIYMSWTLGFTGNGTVIAIVDDGIYANHTDLSDNFCLSVQLTETEVADLYADDHIVAYRKTSDIEFFIVAAQKDPFLGANSFKDRSTHFNATLSFDIIVNSSDASHKWPTEGHGTNCAGVAAAAQNEDCVVGIAYEATFAAIRLLDEKQAATPSLEAKALVHNLHSIDIYSNSWGPTDDGAGFDQSDALYEVQEAALIHGVTLGRNGKGAIYVWAAGNGGDNDDDCNVDGYSNSMYTISISAIRPDGSATYYSEECTAIMAVTYGGDEFSDQIATTDPNNLCIDDFQGTSAACPMAAGIIALALQANPSLSWRDIQHLIVNTSSSTSLEDANFYTNGAGMKVSLSHGFGMMNATAMVVSAKLWNTVPKRIHCNVPELNINRSSSGTASLLVSYRVDNCFINHLEHALLNLTYRVLWREYTSIFLISPAGTESRILRERKNDMESSEVKWRFMSLHTWGEKPVGTWKIRFDSTTNYNKLYLYSLKIDLYGTVTDPLKGITNETEIGGYCNATVICRDANWFCLQDDNICIDCSNGYHIIGNNCIQDGTMSGFCNISKGCLDLDLGFGCNSTSSRCVLCGSGYHIINGFCIEDGELGGYCNLTVKCNVIETGCNRSSEICVNCTDGYRVINNFCVQDGKLGGYCDNVTECTLLGTGCNATTSICVNCLSGYHVINKLCLEDGSLGGFCNTSVHCTEADVGCDNETCIKCETDYRVINHVCKQDGALGGFCDSGINCTTDGAGCNATTNVCVTCLSGYHVIDNFCIKDGSNGGYCNSSLHCTEANNGCNNDTCVFCTAGFHVVNHFCKQDGYLGGRCDTSLSCKGSAVGCDESNKLCILCTSGSHIIGRLCVQDGVDGGYCSESASCKAEKSQCTNNICEPMEDDPGGRTTTYIWVPIVVIVSVLVIATLIIVRLKWSRIKNRIWPKPNKDNGKQINRNVYCISDKLDINISFNKINSFQNSIPSESE